MPKEELDILFKLQHIENVVKTQDTNTEQLRVIVEELSSVVKDLDKAFAIQAEKYIYLNYRMEQLQDDMKALGESGDTTRTRQQDLVEKALMVFLGGLITFVFNLAIKTK